MTPEDDPLAEYLKAGLGGPDRVDLALVAGDSASYAVDLDPPADPASAARLQVRPYNDPTGVPLVDLSTAPGEGITIDVTGAVLNYSFTAAQTTALLDQAAALVYALSLRGPGADPQTLIVGVVSVDRGVVAWP
jgi:hypothetical protein